MGPFHAGELAVQERMGVREELAPWASKVVRPFLPQQHRDFYAALPFVVAAARDADGRPWATLLAGPPGFMRSPDPRRLEIAARPTAGDPLEGRLIPGADLGLLGIDLATRRRNRVNGRIAAEGDALILAVDQTFGNCPQHIHARAWYPAPATPPPASRTLTLTAEQRARIAAADTLFIASGHPRAGEAAAFGMDASHRGGPPGFVVVDSDRRLVIPDYAGNNHFNTVGNLALDGRAGLLFVDFATGGLLHLTGRVTIDWDSPAVARHPGAQRLLIFELDEAVDRPAALPLRWTGEGRATRSLYVVERRRESDDVVSFVLAARDGGPLPGFRGGQHLPIELPIPGAPVHRTYSLSSAPGDDLYRISVKRHPGGLASRFLHDAVAAGDILAARAPAGEFVLAPGERPIVMIAAGIGVTPLLSMLGELARRGDPRRVVFIHVARDGRNHPLAADVRATDHAEVHVFYTRPRPEDRPGRDYDESGRLDAARLAALLPSRDVDVYQCGPVAFMATVQEHLERLGVPAEQIRHETMTTARP